jgi:hypothetical protein
MGLFGANRVHVVGTRVIAAESNSSSTRDCTEWRLDLLRKLAALLFQRALEAFLSVCVINPLRCFATCVALSPSSVTTIVARDTASTIA